MYNIFDVVYEANKDKRTVKIQKKVITLMYYNVLKIQGDL